MNAGGTIEPDGTIRLWKGNIWVRLAPIGSGPLAETARVVDGNVFVPGDVIARPRDASWIEGKGSVDQTFLALEDLDLIYDNVTRTFTQPEARGEELPDVEDPLSWLLFRAVEERIDAEGAAARVPADSGMALADLEEIHRALGAA